jgi:hypothetical protein
VCEHPKDATSLFFVLNFILYLDVVDRDGNGVNVVKWMVAEIVRYGGGKRGGEDDDTKRQDTFAF